MQWGDILKKAVTDGLKAALRSTSSSERSSARRSSGGASRSAGSSRTTGASGGESQSRSGQGSRPGTSAGRGSGGSGGSAYPGDFTGVATLEYRPLADGKPDPGEIVWAWVPFEEDYSQGKDRPALVIAEHQGWLLALMLTSKDHDRDHAAQQRAGREWLDIGTGDWDREGRPSEVRLDRIIQLDPDGVRREGGRLDRKRFELVAAGVVRVNGW